MSGLRSLLRLEDKVAAEARRLQTIGGPSMRWAAPMALIAAAALHGVILLLPAARTQAMPAATSPMPDFPLVWRPAPAPIQPPPPAAARRASPVPAAPEPARNRAAVTTPVRALTTEPVPEPAPELALNTISADIEAIIPNPDPPPPSLEVGPPSGFIPANPHEAEPTVVERVLPVYPVAARSLRAEGSVRLRLAVLQDGTVDRATIEECSRPGLGFEAAALAAVKQWRYEPAPLQPGPRSVTVTIHFQSQGATP
jgi:protein TonB